MNGEREPLTGCKQASFSSLFIVIATAGAVMLFSNFAWPAMENVWCVFKDVVYEHKGLPLLIKFSILLNNTVMNML